MAEAETPMAAEGSEAATEMAERNRQLKAALMDDPEVVAETPADVQDASAAVEEPVTPLSALQKQKSAKRPLARQPSAADQRAAAAEQRAAAAAERATERAAAAATAERVEAQKLERQIREQTAKLEALRERASDIGADREEWAHPKEVSVALY
jgi:hypothetical protein